jgi:hypothetical protein
LSRERKSVTIICCQPWIALPDGLLPSLGGGYPLLLAKSQMRLADFQIRQVWVEAQQLTKGTYSFADLYDQSLRRERVVRLECLLGCVDDGPLAEQALSEAKPICRSWLKQWFLSRKVENALSLNGS